MISQGTPTQWILLLVVACVFSITLPVFAGFHIFLICRNRTTLDNMFGSPSERRAFSRCARFYANRARLTQSRFDMGIESNWRQTMGDSPLEWFLPLPLSGTKQAMAGIAFETRLPGHSNDEEP